MLIFLCYAPDQAVPVHTGSQLTSPGRDGKCSAQFSTSGLKNCRPRRQRIRRCRAAAPKESAAARPGDGSLPSTKRSGRSHLLSPGNSTKWVRKLIRERLKKKKKKFLCRYLGGKGKMAQFNKEWQDLGLNKEQAAHVRRAIIKRS